MSDPGRFHLRGYPCREHQGNIWVFMAAPGPLPDPLPEIITLDGFEKRWQDRTRARYGALAIAADLTIATLFFLALLMPLWVMRRRRDRRRLAVLRAADVLAEQRQREMAIDELLRAIPSPPLPPGAAAPDRDTPES